MARIVSEEVVAQPNTQLNEDEIRFLTTAEVRLGDKIFQLPVPRPPHKVIGEILQKSSLMLGGQRTPMYGPTTVAEYYQPFQRGKIPGVVLGFGEELPRTYPSTPEVSTVEFRVRNASDENKTLRVQVVQRFCKFLRGQRCEWDRSYVPAGMPVTVTLRPGGIRDVDLSYYTPPHPAQPNPNMGDIVRMDVVFLVTDQYGNQGGVLRQMRPRGVSFPI